MAGLSDAPRRSTAPFTMLPRGVTHQESSRIIGKLCCSSGAPSHNNRGVPVRRRSSKAGQDGAQDTHPQAQLPSCSQLLSRLRTPGSALLRPPQLGNFLIAFPSLEMRGKFLDGAGLLQSWCAKHNPALEEVHGAAWARRPEHQSHCPPGDPREATN